MPTAALAIGDSMTTQNEALGGRVAIISGALGDIGRAIALDLARRGADIALGDVVAESAAADLLARIRELGRRARYDRTDVTDAAAVAAWVHASETELGVAELVIVNAAIVEPTPALELSPESWRRQIQVDLDGAFHLAQTTAKRLVATGRGGRIVFIGSWAADRPHPHIPAYSAAKAGVRMLCRCLALELAGHGILVNEVAPGYVDAGLSGRMFAADPGLRQACERQIPIGSLISAEDVAREVAHLCSAHNRHTTGTTLLIDGGLSLLSQRGHDA